MDKPWILRKMKVRGLNNRVAIFFVCVQRDFNSMYEIVIIRLLLSVDVSQSSLLAELIEM